MGKCSETITYLFCNQFAFFCVSWWMLGLILLRNQNDLDSGSEITDTHQHCTPLLLVGLRTTVGGFLCFQSAIFITVVAHQCCVEICPQEEIWMVKFHLKRERGGGESSSIYSEYPFAFWVDLLVHMRLLTLWSFFQRSQSKTHSLCSNQSYFKLYQKQQSLKALSAKSDMGEVWREFEWAEKPYSCSKYEWICCWPFEKKRVFHEFSGRHVRHEIKDLTVVLKILCSFLTSCCYYPA